MTLILHSIRNVMSILTPETPCHLPGLGVFRGSFLGTFPSLWLVVTFFCLTVSANFASPPAAKLPFSLPARFPSVLPPTPTPTPTVAVELGDVSTPPAPLSSVSPPAVRSPVFRYLLTRLITFFWERVSLKSATWHRMAYWGQQVWDIVGLYTYLPLLKQHFVFTQTTQDRDPEWIKQIICWPCKSTPAVNVLVTRQLMGQISHQWHNQYYLPVDDINVKN